MNVAELKEMDDAVSALTVKVDALLAKLAEAKRLYYELPSPDEFEEMAKLLDAVTRNLEMATEAYSADGFPTTDELEELNREASSLSVALQVDPDYVGGLSVSRRAEIGDKLTADGVKVGDKLTVA